MSFLARIALLIVLLNAALQYGDARKVSGKKNDKFQVFAFAYPDDPDFDEIYPKFDWNKLTTIALAATPDLPIDQTFVKHAHANNVNVVAMCNVSRSGLPDPAYRAKLIGQRVSYIMKNNLDGVNFNFLEPVKERSVEAKAYVKLIQGMSKRLKKMKSSMEVSVNLPYSPDCIGGRCYPAGDISKIVDKMFIMAYDEGNQGHAFCESIPNSPIGKTTDGIKRYLSIGVNKDKMILGLPWFGYKYYCSPDMFANYCQVDPYFPHSNEESSTVCGPKSAKMLPYKDLMEIMVEGTAPLRWNGTSETPFYNLDVQVVPGWDYFIQVQFDNAESLKIKSGLAKELNLAGVGIWHVNALNYTLDAQVKDMWGAIP